jgi:hypothetical protein
MTDDQIPFDHPDLVANPEPRCACLLLLDTSGSMHGQPIAELNAGLVTLKDELMADAMAVQRVEIGVISFGPVRVHSDFKAQIHGALRISKQAATHQWVPRLSRDCKCSMRGNRSTSKAGLPIIDHGFS